MSTEDRDIELFTYRRLNAVGSRKCLHVQDVFEIALDSLKVHAHGGDARCLAVMRSKLEEACFYAKKAIALNPDNEDKS